MSHSIHTVESAQAGIAGHTKRNTYARSRGVCNCNGCGRRIEAGEPVAVYGVYKDVPGSKSQVWHPIATFCSGGSSLEYCNIGALSNVSDDAVGQPGGRPGYERYWSHKPEILVTGTYMETFSGEMYTLAVSSLMDHSFGVVHSSGSAAGEVEQ